MAGKHIRRAEAGDASRIAEIEIFNYRLNFYPIFRNDGYYFGELQVSQQISDLLADPKRLENTYVYDDGVVKGFIAIEGHRVKKLFVEPVLQGQTIGAQLLEFAIADFSVTELWALEKNTRALAFYGRHGFLPTADRMPEEGTNEYLVRLERKKQELH